VLGWVGAQLPSGLPLRIGQVATVYYFFHFLILLPILGKIERPLPLPSSISEAVTGSGGGGSAKGGEA